MIKFKGKSKELAWVIMQNSKQSFCFLATNFHTKKLFFNQMLFLLK
jgi:hypothetical protein